MIDAYSIDKTSFNLQFLQTHDSLSLTTTLHHSIPSNYQAILPNQLRGHFLTPHFLTSSKNKIPNPKAAGRKKCSAGTLLVPKTLCNCGMYNQKIAITNAKRIAGKMYRFWVTLLKTGGCWKILRRRVRRAMRLNHCLECVSRI